MTTRHTQARQGRLAFAILVAIVIVSGAFLWTQGDLINPLQSTTLLMELSSGEAGFAMVGEEGTRPDAPTTTTEQSTTESTTIAAEAVEASPVEQMTLEAFTAELAAAGVDVEAVTATMTAEGRSLENLLAVVNSGRVSVADLAARLMGESSTATTTSEAEGTLPPGEGSSELLNLRWDELGSVAYDLWVILATTVLLIVISRPVGWLVNRLKSVTQSRVGHAVSS